MILQIIDELTGNIATIYKTIINSIDGELESIKSSSNPSSSSSKLRFKMNADLMVRNMMSVYERNIKEATLHIVDNIIKDNFSLEEISKIESLDDGKLNEYIDQSIQAVTYLVNSRIIRHVYNGTSQLRSIGFDVITNMQSVGIENAIKGAVVKNIVGNQGGSKVKDRQIGMDAYLIPRGHFMKMANDALIYAASLLGEDEFVVRNEDSNHRYNNLELSLSGENSPSYASFSSAITHPNSKSLVYRKK